MTHLLNCPVCGYKEIQGNTCPNCDADLSLMRSLTELPALERAGNAEDAGGAGGVKLSKVAIWQVGVALLILILGIGLGTLGSFLFLQPQLISNKITSPPVAIKSDKTPSAIAQEPAKRLGQPSQTYYKVKPGDSLSKIAERFYGDDTLWTSLVKANPNIKGREDFLDIGEPLIIPNREEACRGNF